MYVLVTCENLQQQQHKQIKASICAAQLLGTIKFIIYKNPNFSSVKQLT